MIRDILDVITNALQIATMQPNALASTSTGDYRDRRQQTEMLSRKLLSGRKNHHTNLLRTWLYNA